MLFVLAAELVLAHYAVPVTAQFKLPQPDSQNPFAQLEEAAKQKAAENAIESLLNNQLPLRLDANAIYPTVAAPPGGPFTPRPVTLTAADLDRPLSPGDYTMNMLAFCTEYSVHRPGAGVAYRLGPLQGKAAGAIGDLLWRGTFQKNLPPQQLQAVSWAIQSGLRYSQMPSTYQAVIDNVIPDHKNELNGDFFESMEDSYTNLAKGTKLPPLQQLLGGMGKAGQLALSADRQRQALLQQNTTDQIKEQTLFAGQDQGVYTPVKAEDGPWTERIPGVAYLRYQIVGGNMARNNIMQIRILPQAGSSLKADAPRSTYAGFSVKTVSFSSAAPRPARQTETPPSTSPQSLIGGSIGCAVGQGAQCLIPIPATASCDMPCVGHVQEVAGQVQIKRGNSLMTLKPGDQINLNDRIITGDNSSALVSFSDGSQMTLGGKTSLVVDDYVFDPNNNADNKARYEWLEGAFQYVSGLIGQHEVVETEGLCCGGGIRGEGYPAAPPILARRYISGAAVVPAAFAAKGNVAGLNSPITASPQAQNSATTGNEFIASYDTASKTAEIDLIAGQLYVTPSKTVSETSFTGPVKITMNQSSASGSPLTRAEYDAIKARLFPSQ